MHQRRSRGRLAAVLLSAAAAWGCATTRDNAFLVRRVDGPAKSRAVTEQGIALYELRVLGRQEYDVLKDARRHFEVALRFDGDNTRARQYLEAVDDFREAQLASRTAQAAALLRKPDRSEDETYALLLHVRLARALSATDDRVEALRRDAEQAEAALVPRLMARAMSAEEEAAAEQAPARREEKLLLVKDQYDRIHAIHPDDGELKRRRASVRAELDLIFADRAGGVGRLTEAGQFLEAQDAISRLDALNRRLDYTHDATIRGLEYGLYLQWSRAALKQGQLGLAEARIDAALRARRSDDAEALRGEILRERQRIAAQAAAQAAARSGARQAASAAAAHEAALREVQDLVRRDELVAASRRIAALLSETDDRQMTAGLREQQAAVQARLPDLYARGVEAYRSEDFKRAVDLLSVVVEIDVGFAQAADYLDKARAKQKLLEGLQGNRG